MLKRIYNTLFNRKKKVYITLGSINRIPDLQHKKAIYTYYLVKENRYRTTWVMVLDVPFEMNGNILTFINDGIEYVIKKEYCPGTNYKVQSFEEYITNQLTL